MSIGSITKNEAIEFLTTAPLIEVIAAAHAERVRRYGDKDVTFVCDFNPNYTNICVTDCIFCSFYKKPGDQNGYVLTIQELTDKAIAARALGTTTMLLQGGHNPNIPLEYYLSLIKAISVSVPDMHMHFFSPPEIDQISRTSKMSWLEVLLRLREAGLQTIPGGGAEILVDKVRKRISPKKIDSKSWMEIMRLAHSVGFKTTATMMFGHLESPSDIIEHMQLIQNLQSETGGFYAFIPWSFKPGSSPLSRIVKEYAGPDKYLRVIAVARLLLTDVQHIQASWFGEGVRLGQLALHAGADDFGGVLLEENVLFSAEHKVASSKLDIISMIHNAGFSAVQRSTLYQRVAVFERNNDIKRSIELKQRQVGLN